MIPVSKKKKKKIRFAVQWFFCVVGVIGNMKHCRALRHALRTIIDRISLHSSNIYSLKTKTKSIEYKLKIN